ncbi:hypothetical protein FQZ97_1118170 [compost metagenome]
MTFSPTERLYSMMTGQWFSSSPNESMRPPCVLPVEYSDARKRIPRKVCRLPSIRFCIGFSRSEAEPCSSAAWPLAIRKSLMSLMASHTEEVVHWEGHREALRAAKATAGTPVAVAWFVSRRAG